MKLIKSENKSDYRNHRTAYQFYQSYKKKSFCFYLYIDGVANMMTVYVSVLRTNATP